MSGLIWAEICHTAGVPAGVFNLINGDGPSVGQVLAGHKDVDVVSFTGSTRAGVIVAKTAADTVKRVSQELGGKSANIIMEDADIDVAIAQSQVGLYLNQGQCCIAGSRLFVHEKIYDEFVKRCKGEIDAYLASPDRGKDKRAAQKFAAEINGWAKTVARAAKKHWAEQLLAAFAGKETITVRGKEQVDPAVEALRKIAGVKAPAKK
jgi:acyl-CoA reductase-like NAD-dependent aldehyde dehydrogenase